jgi:hypothetical protein
MEIFLKPNLEDILPWLERRKGKKKFFLWSSFKDKVAREVSKVMNFAEPQGNFKEVPITYCPLRINDWSINSKDLTSLLEDKPHRGLFLAVTLGIRLDQKIAAWQKKGEIEKAFIWDGIGSYLAEESIKELNKRIKYRFAQKEKRLTSRYSPGYGDWNLNIQGKILSLFPELKIKVNRENLMIPQKSITAFCGIL